MKTGIPTNEEKELLRHLSLFKGQRFVSLNSQNLDSLAELESRGYVYESYGTVDSITSMRIWDVALWRLTAEGDKAYRDLKRDNWSYLLFQNVRERLARAC